MPQQPHDDSDNELRGLFARATSDITPWRDIADGARNRIERGHTSQAGGSSHGRGPAIVGAISAVLVVALLGGVFLALRSQRGGTGGSGGASATATTSSATFTVTSVAITVSPSSIAGEACGSNVTFTYTATFHVPAHTAGGTIQYNYTLNNGRSQTPGALQVAAGQTTATTTFTSSGTLSPDNTYPGPAAVMVTTPNSVTSNTAVVSGTCAQPSSAFSVKAVAIALDPNTLSGRSCGTSLTENYIATFALVPNGPGGTIHFMYTTDNGRSSTPASLTVAAGQTTATYTFTWSGTLPADHTAPGNGGVIVTAPNSISSSLVGPSGQCS